MYGRIIFVRKAMAIILSNMRNYKTIIFPTKTAVFFCGIQVPGLRLAGFPSQRPGLDEAGRSSSRELYLGHTELEPYYGTKEEEGGSVRTQVHSGGRF